MYLIFTQVSDLTLLLNEARDQNVLNIKNFCFDNLFFVPHNCSALIEENHLEKIFWKYGCCWPKLDSTSIGDPDKSH